MGPTLHRFGTVTVSDTKFIWSLSTRARYVLYLVPWLILTTLKGKYRDVFQREIMFAHRECSPDCRVAIAVHVDPSEHHFRGLPRTRIFYTRHDRNCRVRWDNCLEDLEHRRHASWREGNMEVPNLARADREEDRRWEGQRHPNHSTQVYRVR